MEPGRVECRGSTARAAKILGVDERTVRRLIDDGTVPAFKPGKRKWVVDLLACERIANKGIAA